MHTTMLKAKLHRARVTHSELEYEGSCAIDGLLLDRSGIREYEQIQIYNVNNGDRFTTYAIRAQEGSGTISVNGAAARRAAVGDVLIICAYVMLNQTELASYHPNLIYVNERNQIIRVGYTVPVQAA
ncbi:MAG: aspartate 1-decarboxylase [Methylotetracoccus sp.]|jgi:aspartate 1-decarboxylase|nr:aspartate 1-decarboxylase [Methylotetracoccus sp.]